MSSNPPNVFRRLRSRFKTQKDHENPAKPSTTSTPATQSRDASPSRAEARPATVLKEATPEALPLNAPERLWDEAYDAIRHDDANLVDGYERILSQYLCDRGLVADSDISQQNTIAANSPDVRRKQMNELIRAGLDKTAREAKVKDGLGTAMGIILSLKNMVSTAVAAVPQASIAWSGVCIALGVLEGAIKETAMNRDGIEYIITRIRWYGNVSSLLLDEGTLDDSALSGMKSELEKRLVELYKALLIYQMRSVCSHHRNGSYSFLRDLLKVDDWAVSIQDIQKAEDSLRQDAEVYGNQQFRSRLEHIVDHAKSQELEIKNMARTLEEQLRRQISAEDRNCLRELWPHDPYVEKRRIEDTKGGLLQDSFNWILENDDFCRWFKDPNRPLLWIRGDPGKGKTMLLCGIVDNLQKLAPSSLISFFFCQATDERINNSTAVLRGLIFSLIDQQQHLLEHLREPYARQGKSLFEPPSAWYALSSILQSLLSDLNNTQQPTCLLVDALDECVNEDMPRLLDFIVKMSNELPHVKWVVSSRNWPQIIDKLKNLGPESQLSLELNAESVNAAVQIYIKRKVLQLSESKGYNKKKEEAVRDYLLSNADGTFLWVALSCKNLERASPWIDFTLLQKIPPGLDSLYEQMVNTLARCDEAEICKRILAVATVARRPVTLEELIVLAETPGESDEKSEAVCDLIGQCGSFLTIRDEVVYFVHQSAKDFLVETAAKKTFFLGIEKASHYMVARSIKLMSETLKRDIYGIKDLGIHIDDVQVLTSQPLTAIGYSCVHWVDHFMDTIPSMDEETIDATQRFIETKYLCWLEALSLLRKLPEGVMAMRKLQEFFRKEMPQDPDRLIRDAYRFILAATQIIESFPLQIHPLAHLICPTESKIRQLSIKEYASLFQMKHGMKLDWDSCMQTIDAEFLADPHIALSTDGKLLASISRYGIKIWDMATGTPLKILAHPFRVLKYDFEEDVYLLFSPNGQQLVVSSSQRGEIDVWNIESGQHQNTMEVNLDSGYNLCFSPDGRYLVTEWDDGIVSPEISPRIRIWDMGSGRCVRTLEITGKIYSISFSSNGKLLAVCSSTKMIKIWDDGGKCIHTSILKEKWKPEAYFIGGRRPCVCFSPDLSRLAFCDADRNVKILDIPPNQCTHTIDPGYEISLLTFLPNGKQLAMTVSSLSNRIFIWDIDSNENLRTLKGHTQYIRSMAVSPNSSQLVSASRDETIRVWDISPEADDPKMWEGHDRSFCMTFSPDGKKLATGSWDKTVKIWDAVVEGSVQTLIGHQNPIYLIAFSSDGKLLASASSVNDIKIWDIANSICIRNLIGHTDSIRLIKFSPDSQSLASAADDETMIIWGLAIDSSITLRLSITETDLSQPKKIVHSIDFTKDGEILVSSLEDGTINIWDVISGNCIQTFHHPQRYPFAFFSPSGELLASGSDDQVKIWSKDDGTFECIQTLKLQSRFSRFSFSPDGKQLIAGSMKSSVTIIWDVDVSTGLATSPRTERCVYSSFMSSAYSQKEIPGISELCLFGFHDSWITRNGHRILRLPKELRPAVPNEYYMIVHGKTAAIRGPNNRLAILSFSSDEE